MKRHTSNFVIDNSTNFKKEILEWADRNFETVCYLDNNQFSQYTYRSYESLIAVGAKDVLQLNYGNAFNSLKDFYESKKDWLFGFLGYDLKNEIENLQSKNQDSLEFPDLFFFQPEWVIEIYENHAVVHCLTPTPSPKERGVRAASQFPTGIFEKHLKYEGAGSEIRYGLDTLSFGEGRGEALTPRTSKTEYLQTIKKIQSHIKRGDIYEMNFCQEFFAEKAKLNPLQAFNQLNEISRAPFACYLKFNGNYLLSASPERFLKKQGRKLISMPIKGTARRGRNLEEDAVLRDKLLEDPKERSENVMIVDLVRNDLSRSCDSGSVKVEELFGIKVFEQVHQMVSAISGTLRDDVHFIDAIKNAFPMGSMTGAPKVRAMELIEQYEKTKRGLYSGAVGYIKPDGDFDFNVVIRSLLYNSINQYLSLHVGSAIVADSVPEKEYEECLLKAKVLREILQSQTFSHSEKV